MNKRERELEELTHFAASFDSHMDSAYDFAKKIQQAGFTKFDVEELKRWVGKGKEKLNQQRKVISESMYVFMDKVYQEILDKIKELEDGT